MGNQTFMQTTSSVQRLLRSREQAKPGKQRTADQQQNGQLNSHSIFIAGQEEEQQAAQQHADANAHQPTKLMLKGSPGYEAATGLAGRFL